MDQATKYFFEIIKEDGKIEYRACSIGSVAKQYDGNISINPRVSDFYSTDMNECISKETYGGTIEDLFPVFE